MIAQNCVKVIVLRCLIPLLKSAPSAAVKNCVFSALELHAHGFHGSLAGSLSIARIYVNVLAPKARRAVVGVTTALHAKTAPFASEVFLGALEFLCRHDL